MLAFRRQPFEQFLCRGAGIGVVAAVSPVDAEERVGFLGARRHDAAGTVILVGPRGEMHSVGEQRRGQGVALDAGIGLAVKAERNADCAFDAPAFGGPEAAHFPASSISRSVGRGFPAW